MAHRLAERTNTKKETTTVLSFRRFTFLFCVLTVDRAPLLRADRILSFFRARMHLHLSVYLHGPQHSRQMGVSLVNLSFHPCCKAGKYYYHLSHLCLWLRGKEVRCPKSDLSKVRQQPGKLRHRTCLARMSPAAALPME